MKVHELMSELAQCVAGCDVMLCVGAEMYEVDYATCCNHDGAFCFLSAKPKPQSASDLMTVTVDKAQLLEVAEELGGGDISVHAFVGQEGEHGRG